ncbi:MAG: DUF3617 domain-containing protein [Casimicrobiaceae bacterium]|nr:DUF3617 domain-containing protein [Casimicrobiaceae bacterium]
MRRNSTVFWLLGSLALYVLMTPWAQAQTPGLWRYTIETDQTRLPADMRVNFPTVRFERCLSPEHFADGRAFSVQPTPGSEPRCRVLSFERTRGNPRDRVQLRFDCDEGRSVAGEGRGEVAEQSFTLVHETRLNPVVGGVEQLTQTVRGVYLGACPAAR